jgi:hypothetical protein
MEKKETDEINIVLPNAIDLLTVFNKNMRRLQQATERDSFSI